MNSLMRSMARIAARWRGSRPNRSSARTPRGRYHSMSCARPPALQPRRQSRSSATPAPLVNAVTQIVMLRKFHKFRSTTHSPLCCWCLLASWMHSPMHSTAWSSPFCISGCNIEAATGPSSGGIGRSSGSAHRNHALCVWEHGRTSKVIKHCRSRVAYIWSSVSVLSHVTQTASGVNAVRA